MKYLKFRLISMGLVMVLFVTIFIGCVASSTSTQDTSASAKTESEAAPASTESPSKDGTQKTITVWCWDKNFNVGIMELGAEIYNRDNPKLKVDIVDMALPDVEKNLLAGLSSNAVNTLPNIALIADFSATKFLTSFPGMFEDLTGKLPYDDFAKYKVTYGIVDGKNYSVPFDSGVSGNFYRRDYYEQAGIKEEDIQSLTWDQFVEIGKKIKAATGKALLRWDRNALGGDVEMFMQTTGKWIYDDKGELNIINNPELKKTFETFKLIDSAGVTKLVNGWGEQVASLNDGSVASCVTGVWHVGNICDAEDQAGKWGVAPTPRLDIPGAVNYSNNGGSSWYFIKGKENNDEAIAFMKALYAGNDEFYGQIMTKFGAVGTYFPSQKIKEYTDPQPFFNNQPIFKVFSEYMENVPSMSYGLNTGEARSVFSQVLVEYLDGKIDIDTALKRCDEMLRTVIGG